MIRASWLTAAAIGSLIALASCTAPRNEAAPPAASTANVEQAAWDAIAKGAVVVDVRTDEEFQQGHLPQALHIPFDELSARAAEIPGDKNQAIVLYCRSGRRSGIGKHTLDSLGYTNTMNGGGYDALTQARPQ